MKRPTASEAANSGPDAGSAARASGSGAAPLKRPRRPAPGTGTGIPIPREHGAWAVLYAPVLSAILIEGRFTLSLGWFLVAVTGLFMAHEPLARLARAGWPFSGMGGRARLWWRWAAVEAAVTAIAGAVLWLGYGLADLPLLGMVTAVLLAVHLMRVGRRNERSVAGEVIGIAGLTLTLPGALYVLEGGWSGRALQLWLLHLLYFVGGIFYVKARVSAFVGRPEAKTWTLACDIYHIGAVLLVGLSGAAGWFSPWASAALIPAMGRALWGVRQAAPSLNMRRIGYQEVVFTVLFVGLVTAAYRLG